MNTVYFDKAKDRRDHHGRVPSRSERRYARSFDEMVRRSIMEMQARINERDRRIAEIKESIALNAAA